MIQRLTSLLTLVVALGCAPGERRQETPIHVGFPVLPPIDGADPSIRRKETIQVPTRLNLKREGTLVGVSLDESTFVAAEIEVGKNMVVGTQITLTVLPEEERGTVILSDGPPGAHWGTFLEIGAEAVQLQARIEVFETDIPAQHMWGPTAGRYRVLRESRLEGSVTAR